MRKISERKRYNMAKIAIDIGHGNNTFPPDKGVYKGGKGYAEHDFNSKLGVRIKELLEAHGHTVILGQQPFSRDVPLVTRTNLYNRENVDLVVSLHANAGVASAEGRCVFYWHTSAKAKRAAELIVDEIKKAGYSTHGNGLHASMKGSWTNLHITRETKAPAILIEHGFMTNAKDFELIFGSKQAKYIEDMAQADVKAIQRYFGESYKAQPKPKQKPKPSPNKPKPSGKKTASPRLIEDGWWGVQTTRALQQALGTVADGELWNQSRNPITLKITGGVKFGSGGSPVIRVLQKKVGAKVDGYLGVETFRKLQAYLGTPVDGEMWTPSTAVKEMQRRLNAGTF